VIRIEPRRLAALVVKESVQIRRDPSTLLIAFVLPVILLFLFGFGVSLDTARTRIGLVMEDHSAQAEGLARSFARSRWFEVSQTGGVIALRRELSAGRIRGMIVIPSDFGRSVLRGAPKPIEIVTDGSSPNTAGFVAAYAEGVRAAWAGEAQAPVMVEPRFWFNPELKSRFFLVPGSIAIVMSMIGSLLTALVIAREWERGTIEAMFATPITMAEFLISKLAPYVVLALASMTICTLLAVGVFGVPFRGSVLALLIVSAAYLAPALGLGLFISAATKNQFVASQAALLTAFMPALLLSGFIFEISSMPRPIQWLTFLFPARYFIPCLSTVFLAGDLWSVFLPNIAAMLGFGGLWFALAFHFTHRRLD
jgi:ABC-2 type transport system permease protein